MSKIWALSLAAIFFLFALCFDAQSIETKISDADATNIVLRTITKLDEAGSYPRFSPDGKQILFTKKITKKQGNRQSEIMAIWIMDKDGKNKKVLFGDGYNGAWSPDGSKIVYCTPKSFLVGVSKDVLSIYDIKAKKKFELIAVTNCYMADVAWTKDTKSVFYDNHGVGISKWIIDLDTLKTEAVNLSPDNETKWEEANLLIVAHPNVWIYDESMVKGQDIWSYGKGKIWIENRDNSFRRLLLPENVEVKGRSINIHPDLSKILLEMDRGGIYIANLDVLKSLPNRTFRAELNKNDLIKARGGFYKSEYLEEYFKEGTITAAVYKPRINPLNKKTIGAGERLKGYVKIIEMFDNYSIVRVIEEISPITPGDVMTKIRGDHPRPGMGTTMLGTEVWAVLNLQ